MATYNEPVDYISQSVSSILDQTYKNIELIVCDDSTNEDTKAALNNFAKNDSRLHLIRKPKRMGFVKALNEGLKQAKGELIARMDGDDISLPERIEKEVDFALSHPSIDLFGGNMYVINKDGDVISQRTYKSKPNEFKRRFLYRNPLAHPTIMFKRKIIDDGFLYNPDFKKAEDLDFYLRLYKNHYSLSNMNDFLVKYRVLEDQQKKRAKDNWIYNHRARCIFIPSKPLFSIISWTISLFYLYIPAKVISFIYKKENSKAI